MKGLLLPSDAPMHHVTVNAGEGYRKLGNSTRESDTTLLDFLVAPELFGTNLSKAGYRGLRGVAARGLVR